MYTRGNNISDVSKRISDAILADNILDKEKLPSKIRAILSAYFLMNDMPKNYDNIKTPSGILQRKIEEKECTIRFWKNEVQQLKTKEEMQELYKKSDDYLIGLGFLKGEKYPNNQK